MSLLTLQCGIRPRSSVPSLCGRHWALSLTYMEGTKLCVLWCSGSDVGKTRNKTKQNRIWKPNHAQTVKQPTSWVASMHYWSL